MSETILCIDIGNTRTHYGVWSAGGMSRLDAVPTATLDAAGGPLDKALGRVYAGVSWCSVVPEGSQKLRGLLERRSQSGWQLTAEDCPGLVIRYPRPSEIGQDRLANAVGAQVLFGAPSVVIDMGTAVTFDIVGHDGAYEGGVIAPGLAIMTRYLHEQTALLPSLDPDTLVAPEGIGKSTVEAIQLGCVVGFTGMIQALLAHVRAALAREGAALPQVIVTGGSAGSLPLDWERDFAHDPDLTLKGLAEAWQRRHRGRFSVPS